MRAKAAIGKLTGENDDTSPASIIVRRAIEAPIRQIVENAGVEGSIVVGKLLEQKSQTFGFDAQTEQYVDLRRAPASSIRRRSCASRCRTRHRLPAS